MRILHTSDWHLGKKLFKLDRSTEHAAFLDWLIETLKNKEIDLLLIAGDIFDTPTPPHQALEMFYQFLHRVASETKTETFIIAGNHDSGLLLEAPKELLALHRVKVWGKLSQNPRDHWIRFSKGKEEIDVCAIPFFRSYELLPQGEGDALEALKKYITKSKEVPQLLMLHHLAGIYEAAGSEQVISLSGVDSIPKEVLSYFDYVALGHIHKPQRISDNIFYSGSPLPLRFSEDKKKSVILLEFKNQKLKLEHLPIPLSRQLIVIKGNEINWQEMIAGIVVNSPLPAQAEVQLFLENPRSGLVTEIKEALEKKGIELLSYMPTYSKEQKARKEPHKIFELTPLELFEEFYATKFPESKEIPEELKNDFKELMNKVKYAPHTP